METGCSLLLRAQVLKELIMLYKMTIRLILIACCGCGSVAKGQLIDGREQVWHFAQTVSAVRGWTSLDFDDSSWRMGKSPLGFGEPDITTEVFSPPPTSQVPITTYFRTSFDVQDAKLLTRFIVKLRVDDGCVAFLNDRELFRINLPSGPFDANTATLKRMDGFEERLYQQVEFPSDVLVDGNNVLCVEVHQAGNVSSDLFLDLDLFGLKEGTPGQAFVEESAREATAIYSNRHQLDENTPIPNGFLDGGRGMQVDEFGYAVSSREILKVDRKIDARLRKHLSYAASEELQKLDTIDRATRIARYIDSYFTPPEGRGVCEQRSSDLARGFVSREVLLGDVNGYCGAGVCRHRALLFKLMADEAGLKARLVRGNYGTVKNSGGHSWNEIRLDDGRTAVVDVMNPQPDFYFPLIGERSLRRYLTISYMPKYPVEAGVTAEAN